jgi:hypothetical protein
MLSEFFPAHGLRSEDVEALRAELPALRTRLAARGVRLCGNERYLDRLAATAAHVALPVADCKPGERVLFVDEQNRIAPCSFTTDELGLVLGADGGIADVGHLPRLFAARREHRRSAHCADCPSTQVFAKFAG